VRSNGPKADLHRPCAAFRLDEAMLKKVATEAMAKPGNLKARE